MLKSDENGSVFLSDEAKVSGDPFYQNDSGKNVLPLGTVTFEETKAPEGYLINDEVIVRQVAASGSGQTDTLFQIPRIADHVIRGHIQIVKFQEAVDPERSRNFPFPASVFQLLQRPREKPW